MAAQSQLTQATNAYGRQEHLLGRGFTTRAQYDLARQAMETAQAQLDDAQARLRQAEDLVDFTEIRADSAGRAAFYSAMINNGVLTRDEVRELEDREPMGGNAAVLTVQSAMTPLDSIGQAADANTARAALRAFLGYDDDPAKRD